MGAKRGGIGGVSATKDKGGVSAIKDKGGVYGSSGRAGASATPKGRAGGAVPKVKPPVKDALRLVEVRNSKVHGRGVFALKRIAKGTRLWEYMGERMSHKRVNERYADVDERNNHTFLFSVDRNVVIDATHNGNDSRFINHGCDPNCESAVEDRRVFVDVIRTIQPGEELCYDYQIGRDNENDPPDVDVIFACHCGSPKCRGTMLWPPTRPVPRKKRNTAPAKAQTGVRGGGSTSGRGSSAANRRGAVKRKRAA